ncbi:hypothetical protein [Modicisalibacter luteus]|uniref:Uncharacterized protein n=1 Tax=Modicisalibacter luteus TaxID=453962 RepID=A0ABV7M1Z2_9GAMM|nr:hypothetical protein [Halomonas lutea]GHA91780.1 hypothetical protein GCM10007159_11620 [Halomonas lutea]
MKNLPKSFRLAMGVMLANVTLSVGAQDAQPERDYQVPLPPAPSGDAVFQPPLESTIPDNQYGDMVRKSASFS